MKKFIATILAFVVCLGLFTGCDLNILNITGAKDAERAALNYLKENYCWASENTFTSTVENGKNNYTFSCHINQDYDLWQSEGTVKLLVYKENEEWIVTVEEENIEYSFEKNNNWYYASTRGGNHRYLVKMIDVNQDTIILEYYSYEIGSYGSPDDYDHGFDTCELKYSRKNRCFTFDFAGSWRIYGSYIGYNRYEVGANYEYYQSSSDYKKASPVNPEDYWWYEKAKNQPID